MKLLLRLATAGASMLGVALCFAQPIDLVQKRIHAIETALNNGRVQKRLFGPSENEIKQRLKLELDVLLFTLDHFEKLYIEKSEEAVRLFLNNLHTAKAIQCFNRLVAEKREIKEKLTHHLLPQINHKDAKMRALAHQLLVGLAETEDYVDGNINRIILQMMCEKNPKRIRCV